ncbi:hypothetical protein [Actinokineospora terrae]|uniref:Uncharacterized protein n=1 Tax=Actinokineospora terrae TaxID=155974 RepID=A0A1H9N2F4_9PSEU|nr:hypothetical protein [Actinokineospora terrae]SER30156.1 hypothetical protein SAMN04487818_102475 [Actinokineospora terrae]
MAELIDDQVRSARRRTPTHPRAAGDREIPDTGAQLRRHRPSKELIRG